MNFRWYLDTILAVVAGKDSSRSGRRLARAGRQRQDKRKKKRRKSGGMRGGHKKGSREWQESGEKQKRNTLHSINTNG